MPHVFTNQITDISEGFFFDVWDRDQGGKVSRLAEVKGQRLLLYVYLECPVESKNGAGLLLRVKKTMQQTPKLPDTFLLKSICQSTQVYVRTVKKISCFL